MGSQRKCLDKYEFRRLTESNNSGVWDFMAKYFVTREPTSLTKQLSPEEGHEFVGEYTKKACRLGVSLAAYEKDTKKLVAVQLSSLGKLLDDYSVAVPDNIPLKSRQYRESMRAVLGSDLTETLGTKDFMEFILLCCHPDHSNRGIARKLYTRSLQIAKENGVKKVFTMATSYYTQCIAKKLGFKREFEIHYKDYVDPFTGTKIFENMAEPHKVMFLEVLEIS